MLSHFESLTNHVSAFYAGNFPRKLSLPFVLQRATAVALFASCLIVSSLQYFGQPIQCIQDKREEDAAIDENVMNSFCFISGTYTVRTGGHSSECGGRSTLLPSPGSEPVAGDSIQKHHYYVWIPFILFFQALTFLLPFSYWTHVENGIAGKLLGPSADADLELLSAEGRRRLRETSLYFRRRLKMHQFFSVAWIVTDIVGVAVAVGNFFVTNSLLGGHFIDYGPRVLGFLVGGRVGCVSPMDEVFPKLTKCTFYKYGTGGSLQNLDLLCVMALNVVNEKIYAVLWIWFLFLIPISGIWFMFKIGMLTIVTCPSKNQMRRLMKLSWVQSLVGIPCAKSCDTFVEHFTPTDWIFFSHLISEMSSNAYTTFSQCMEEFLQTSATNV